MAHGPLVLIFGLKTFPAFYTRVHIIYTEAEGEVGIP